MNHQSSNWPLLVLTWLFQFISLMDRTTITFILSVVTSILAIACYIIRMWQDLKRRP